VLQTKVPDAIRQEKPRVTDEQLITIAIAVAIPAAAVIYSNSRVGDVKETLRAEMNLGFERISNQIRELKDALHIHEVEHHK
jgi:hypothetical protein